MSRKPIRPPLDRLCAEWRRIQAEGKAYSKRAYAIHKSIRKGVPIDPLIRLANLRRHKDFAGLDQKSRSIPWGEGHIPDHVSAFAIVSVTRGQLKLIDSRSRLEVIARLNKRIELAKARSAALKQRTRRTDDEAA